MIKIILEIFRNNIIRSTSVTNMNMYDAFEAKDIQILES